MAFFISDITGSQRVYNTELVRQIVAEQEPVAAVDSVEEVIGSSDEGSQQISPIPVDVDAGSSTTASLYSPASPEAMGIAAASVLNKGEHGAVTDTDADKVHANRHTRRKQYEQVNPIRKNQQIRAKSEDTPEEIMSTTYAIDAYDHPERPVPDRQPAIRAEQIMTSPVETLSSTDTRATAEELFLRKRFRHVPVIKDGKLIGIVSDRDLFKYRDPETPISKMMTSDIITARPYTEIRMIAQIFFKERISSMPIVDDNELLIGILTTNDILNTVVNHAPLELWV